ncbi:MAG: PhzF family phenazine biosynthesis protein [Salinisphaera sp.]|jgi:PhzF family phenazine biosynthesis protein|nr:PhzF family phenazine biosynthesis protein [Salinisphaera sp.]
MTASVNLLTYHHIDAFTDRPFAGNPAAVYVLDEWLPDERLQAIAAEHNLSETAFVVAGTPAYHALRWFTPACEVELCGHATLASAHVLIRHLGHVPPLTFSTRYSGDLDIDEVDGFIWMDFPGATTQLLNDDTATLDRALGARPDRWLYSPAANLAVFEHPDQVAGLTPDMRALAQRSDRDHRLLIATAPGSNGPHDFVSRVFAPGFGVDEDPVTGSAHCTLAPYWAERLGKTELAARQISARGGELVCQVVDQRVRIGGQAVTFASGTTHIPEDAPTWSV